MRLHLASLAARMSGLTRELELFEHLPPPESFRERFETVRGGILLRIERVLKPPHGTVFARGEEARLAPIVWAALVHEIRYWRNRGGFPHGCLDPIVRILTEMTTVYMSKRAPPEPRLPPGSVTQPAD